MIINGLIRVAGSRDASGSLCFYCRVQTKFQIPNTLFHFLYSSLNKGAVLWAWTCTNRVQEPSILLAFLPFLVLESSKLHSSPKETDHVDYLLRLRPFENAGKGNVNNDENE